MNPQKQGVVVWITGLSGSGKSTLANSTAINLRERGIPCVVLDGDELRQGLCSDLCFSLADRSENARRAGEIAQLFIKAGFIALVALISPLRKDRQKIREKFGPDKFMEIWCHCPLPVCEKRDRKNLYYRARKGEVTDFTGITSIYENPENPELILNTDQLPVEIGAAILSDFILSRMKS